MQSRVDRTLATDPADDRVDSRLKQPAAPGGTAPFVATPDGNNANFKTSLTQWSSALSEADKAAIEHMKTKSGEDLALPKPVKAKPSNFDVWAQGRRERFTDSGGLGKQGNALTSYVGADYRWQKDLLVGGMVQLDDSSQSIAAKPEAVDGSAYMAGPYAAYQVTPHIMLDAKAAWGTANDSAVMGSESQAYAADRMLSEAKVSGNWGWDRWRLSQTGAITYMDEASAVSGMAGTSVDVTRLSVGPEIKRQIDVGNDNSVEPFAFFKSSLDLETGFVDPTTQNTIGGGVSLAKPDKYKLRATADFTESTNTAEDVATGKVSVTVPSNVLGF